MHASATRPAISDPAATADFELTHVNLQLENVFSAAHHGIAGSQPLHIAGPIACRAAFAMHVCTAVRLQPGAGSLWCGRLRRSAALARTFDAPVRSNTRRARCALGDVRSCAIHARRRRYCVDQCQRHVSGNLSRSRSIRCRVGWLSAFGALTTALVDRSSRPSLLALVTASKETIAPLDLRCARRRERRRTGAPSSSGEPRRYQTLAWLATTRRPRSRCAKRWQARDRRHADQRHASWPGAAPSSRR